MGAHTRRPSRRWLQRPVVALTAIAMIAIVGACSRSSTEPATGGPGLAGLNRTWHNTAPTPVTGSTWSWAIVNEMSFSDQGRWDFTLTNGTSCHTEYRLSAVSDTKADLSTSYFRCPPLIDGYLGTPSGLPLEVTGDRLTASGMGNATFESGPATATPVTTPALATGLAAPGVNPVGGWECVVTTRPYITIELHVEDHAWSTKLVDAHDGPTVVGSGQWDGTAGTGHFSGTLTWTSGSKSYEIPVDWTVNGFTRSEVLPFIVNATFLVGIAGSTTASEMKESKRTVSADSVKGDSELQPYVRENGQKITSPDYFQGANQFMINLQRCNRG